MNNEIWKGVPMYDGLYEVSNLGRVRSLGRLTKSKSNSMQKKRKRILTQEVTVHGYCRVRLYDRDGGAKHFAVHRLVMEAFVGKDVREVNHKNEIKTDNRLSNLEYCTSKENCNYGTRNKKLSEVNKKPVLQIDKGGRVIKEYPSHMAAESDTGIDRKSISRVCCGGRKTAGGYRWKNK